jgi:hypothetical protein
MARFFVDRVGGVNGVPGSNVKGIEIWYDRYSSRTKMMEEIQLLDGDE